MSFISSEFINEYTLNIFTDASFTKVQGRDYTCGGAVVTINGSIVDIEYRIYNDSTSNYGELEALSLGVGLASKWRNRVNCINIFSDSQVSVFGIRDRIHNWTLGKDGKLHGYGGTVIKNQDLFVEMVYIITRNQLPINFYHQKGHVSVNNYDSLNNAIHVFCSSNGIREQVDINLIKFITDMNNYVDKYTRKKLHTEELNVSIKPAFHFTPMDGFDMTREYFSNLTNQGGLNNEEK